MRVHQIDFAPEWVKSFKTAEEFAGHPSNAHLFPGATDRDRKSKLKSVWRFFKTGKEVSEPEASDKLTENDGSENDNGGLAVEV